MSDALLQTLYERHPHHFFNAMAMADVVVHACAWSDGGAEFVYGDGTVLSFCDEMNTFVALRSSAASSSSASRTSHAGVPAVVERDMLFTAWTLSKYTAKVTAALALYNHYSPQPRLLAGLLAEEVQLWCEATPMDSLVLAKDVSLLERRVIRTEVEQRTHGSSTITTTSAVPALASSSPARCSVRLGTELTLWCALRRVRLTVHASRLTFTVRWPAPVTSPADTPLYSAPSHPMSSSLACTGGGVDCAVPRGATPMAVTLARLRAAYFVWLEQTFLVAAPPPAWAAMLQLALELDAELAAEAKEDGISKAEEREVEGTVPHNTSADMRAVHDAEAVRRVHSTSGTSQGPSGAAPTLLHGFLPPTASANVTPCRFSAIQPAHLHYLLARSHLAGSHDGDLAAAPCSTKDDASADDVWCAIHGAGATVRWRYDADATGHPPQAMHWCLPLASHDAMPGMPSLPNLLPPFVQNGARAERTGKAMMMMMMAVTVVREDESVVCTLPSRDGYVVQHWRCGASAVAQYVVSSDGQTGLPPALPALRLPRRCVEVAATTRAASASQTRASDDERKAAAAAMTSVQPTQEREHDTQLHTTQRDTSETNTHKTHKTTTASDEEEVVVIDATAQLALRQQYPSSKSYYDAGYEVVDMPFFALHARGRYLRAVVAVAVSLLQRNEAARRRTEAQQPMSDAPHALHEPLPSPQGPCTAPHRDAEHESDEAVDVTYCHTHIDHVGDFVALTNGTIRCSFADRTLLTLIPGRHVWDEEAVLVSCLTRDATRCTLRLTQCTPSHALASYVGLALSFRRHVLHEVAMRGARETECATSTPSPSPVLASQARIEGDAHAPSSPPARCAEENEWGENDDDEQGCTVWRCKIDQLLRQSRQVARVNRSLLLDDDDDDDAYIYAPPS